MSQEQQEKPIARYLPITVELQVPKEMDKQRVSEITLRPPTTNDVILSQKSAANEADQDVLLFANLSDTTEDLIRSLEFYDYNGWRRRSTVFCSRLRNITQGVPRSFRRQRRARLVCQPAHPRTERLAARPG